MNSKIEYRGRKPKDGIAKSSTERARELRDRDVQAMAKAKTADDFAKFADRLIVKAIANAMANGEPESASLISSEIIKRAYSNQGNGKKGGK